MDRWYIYALLKGNTVCNQESIETIEEQLKNIPVDELREGILEHLIASGRKCSNG